MEIGRIDVFPHENNEIDDNEEDSIEE